MRRNSLDKYWLYTWDSDHYSIYQDTDPLRENTHSRTIFTGFTQLWEKVVCISGTQRIILDYISPKGQFFPPQQQDFCWILIYFVGYLHRTTMRGHFSIEWLAQSSQALGSMRPSPLPSSWSSVGPNSTSVTQPESLPGLYCRPRPENQENQARRGQRLNPFSYPCLAGPEMCTHTKRSSPLHNNHQGRFAFPQMNSPQDLSLDGEHTLIEIVSCCFGVCVKLCIGGINWLRDKEFISNSYIWFSS